MFSSFRSIATACAVAMVATSALAQSSPPAPPVEPNQVVTPQLNRADLEAWLDGFVPYALQQGDIAGFVVAIVKDGQVLLEKGYGYADVVKQVPADPQRTVMRAASVSKAFTATAVMQLVEQGKLDLDRDVNEYLDFKLPSDSGKPTTLRNLLTHTAGFGETSYKSYSPPRSLRESLLDIPPRIYPTGEIPAYSNYSLNLAGYIVARVSGESISQYVEKHILEPLQMHHSTFHVTLPEALRSLEANNYRIASAREPYPPDVIVALSPVDSPAGGLATTAHDMTRFMLAHLQQGRYQDYQLLQPQTLERMHAPSFEPIPGAPPVALGLFRNDYKGHRVIGHSGDGEGFHTEMKLLPDQNIGVFVAANSDGAVQGIMPAAFTLRASLFEQFVDRYFPAQSVQEPTVATAQEHARLAAGEYVWSRQPKGDFQEALFLLARFAALRMEIRANEDGTIETTPFLLLEKDGRPKTWREVGPFVWQQIGGNAHIYMKVENDKVQSVWTDAIGSFWISLRVPTFRSAGLHVPLLLAATFALLFTVALWPVAAVVRRHYGRVFMLPERERRAHRLTLCAALLASIYMVGWLIAMIADFASSLDAVPWVRLLQLLGVICIAGAGVAVWNAWLTWQSGRSGWAKVWSVVMALALLYLVWFSFSFHLISAHLS